MSLLVEGPLYDRINKAVLNNDQKELTIIIKKYFPMIGSARIIASYDEFGEIFDLFLLVNTGTKTKTYLLERVESIKTMADRIKELSGI